MLLTRGPSSKKAIQMLPSWLTSSPCRKLAGAGWARSLAVGVVARPPLPLLLPSLAVGCEERWLCSPRLLEPLARSWSRASPRCWPRWDCYGRRQEGPARQPGITEQAHWIPIPTPPCTSQCSRSALIYPPSSPRPPPLPPHAPSLVPSCWVAWPTSWQTTCLTYRRRWGPHRQTSGDSPWVPSHLHPPPRPHPRPAPPPHLTPDSPNPHSTSPAGAPPSIQPPWE
mmetsp:Transcript_25545/g.35230  ORF Transcript_25545/g.35230 Transcript_25545/m.35230 type:complete len:226 (-) Transcript_25545:793-1470(-)